MNIKALVNGQYVDEITSAHLTETPISTKNDPNEALNEFVTTLASAETDSIAAIREAAQKFLNETENL